MTEVFVEEFFAPEFDNGSGSDSDNDSIISVIIPTKRYATRSNTIIANKLIEDNLNQIISKKNNFSNKLEERIHYLQLELANKDLELIELNNKVIQQDKIIVSIQEYETLLEIIAKNINVYIELINKLDIMSLSYREAIALELLQIKNIPTPLSTDLPTHTQFALSHLYNISLNTEEELKNKFQESLLYQSTKDYIRLINIMKFGAIIFLFLLFLYIYFRW